MAEELIKYVFNLLSGGTDNHLLLIDLRPFGIGLGKKAAVTLEKAGIIVNANTVPYDPSTPFQPSGIRLGTPALTTQGMKEEEMKRIGEWIAAVIHNLNNNEELYIKIRLQIEELCGKFPLYQNVSY